MARLTAVKISKHQDHVSEILEFQQRMANRLAVGVFRHGEKGSFDAVQDYLRRAKKCLERYDATGNTEHLIDAANYCLLEFYCSLHPNAHYKAEDSHGSTV